MVADYDLVRGANNADAKETVRSARAMVDVIMARWDFYYIATKEIDED
jgi:hypothetical protein